MHTFLNVTFFVLMNLKCMYFHFLFLCAVVKNFDLVIPDSMSRISEFKDVFYIECIQFLRSTQFYFSISPLSWLNFLYAFSIKLKWANVYVEI
jgi:hypothetical protein